MADRVPTACIYDCGYMMHALGREICEYYVSNAADRLNIIEQMFLRHSVDLYFVHTGTTDDWANRHSVEKHDGYWLVTVKGTGEQHRLLPDGNRADVDGTPVPRAPSHNGVSKIQSWEDLEAAAIPSMTETQYEEARVYEPLQHLVQTYPDHHFCTQIGDPFVMAMGACGGYVEGLMTMASEPEMFKELMRRCTRSALVRISPAGEAGAHSVLFTSYYCGADSISPNQYREFVAPYAREVCQAYKDAGFFVLNWFLGDLMPILDQLMELPLDALFLEQGRKGYTTDPVEIRKRVGPEFCLIGFGFEGDYVRLNRYGLTRELRRQIDGAGRDGAFIAGTPIMPPNAQPEAVDFYFAEAQRLGRYGPT